MRKKIACLLTIASLSFSSYLHAENKEVPKASKESADVYNQKNWQPWAIGIATVIVAAAGITLVSAKK